MEVVKFITRIRVWNQKKGGKTYRRLVIIVPKELSGFLEENKEYIITITPK